MWQKGTEMKMFFGAQTGPPTDSQKETKKHTVISGFTDTSDTILAIAFA
jgi:hypothetical protein